MIAENPPRPTQSRTTSCHVFSALARQQGHQDILYRSASESRFGRRERKRRKQIDPRNRPNCQVGSKTLMSAIMPNPRGDAVHKHAPGTLVGLDYPLSLCAPDGPSTKPGIFGHSRRLSLVQAKRA
jgi:hypothetical protein